MRFPMLSKTCDGLESPKDMDSNVDTTQYERILLVDASLLFLFIIKFWNNLVFVYTFSTISMFL